MMKKIFYGMMLLLSAATLAAQEGYTVSGTLENQGNEKIIITYFDGARNVVNEVQAVNGKFVITGVAPAKPEVARLTTSYDRNTYFGENKSSMFMPGPPLEIVLSANAKLEVTGDVKTLNFATVKGDAYNEAFNKYRKSNEEYAKKMTELQGYIVEARKMGVTDGLKEFGEQMVQTRKKSIDNQKKFIQDNPNELVSVWLLAMAAKEYDLAGLKSAYAALSSPLKETQYGQAVASRIAIVSSTESGKAAPDFTKPGIDGQAVKLSQFKGKYLLLDFWGSWCAPCRASNPHLKELYAKYKDKGFEILGVACEKSPKLEDGIAAWKKAVATDGLTWTQVINNEENQKSNLIQLYGIDGYPTKILIDPKGNIVARWLGSNGNELDVKLKEIFNF